MTKYHTPVSTEHAEAMAGFLVVLSALPVTSTLLACILGLGPVFGAFPLCVLLQWSAATHFDEVMATLDPAMQLLTGDQRGHAQALLREYRAHCQQAGE